ncbi:hypothetical protein NDU88_001440 [Pleurodeles waltl]|uniref:Secreted protein n=1 Tax=Pleurodeles waltl TaxID=8319 RepID=A0AAV7THU3_PLEWA|nr:hypothetical protein NDU88_001440 [Pleurodeles waltl]
MCGTDSSVPARPGFFRANLRRPPTPTVPATILCWALLRRAATEARPPRRGSLSRSHWSPEGPEASVTVVHATSPKRRGSFLCFLRCQCGCGFLLSPLEAPVSAAR